MFFKTIKDIRYLHYSIDSNEFENQKRDVLKKWRNNNMIEFATYFENQWLNSVFRKWQIFYTPAGYASTANPCESFNGKK